MILAANELAVQTRKSVEHVTRDSKEVDKGVARVQDDLNKKKRIGNMDLPTEKIVATEEKKAEAFGVHPQESEVEKEEAAVEKKHPAARKQKATMAAQKSAIVKLTELKIMTKA